MLIIRAYRNADTSFPHTWGSVYVYIESMMRHPTPFDITELVFEAMNLPLPVIFLHHSTKISGILPPIRPYIQFTVSSACNFRTAILKPDAIFDTMVYASFVFSIPWVHTDCAVRAKPGFFRNEQWHIFGETWHRGYK